MFRHVVLMTWGPGTTGDQVSAVLDGLAGLPAAIPGIRAYSFGTDAGLAPDNADLAVVADFDDEDGYRAYAAHPAHVALVTEHIRPILASRTAVQYRTGTGA
ncbi:MAG: Dabb family protein [Actinomycetota bacterium]|nr:Dabb family protein [Actinomycetota bacterium]